VRSPTIVPDELKPVAVSAEVKADAKAVFALNVDANVDEDAAAAVAAVD
jgi:hypothetical protein